MPQPSDLHVNQFLTSVSVAFTQDPNGFVADTVFPRVPSDKQSNYYATFPIGSFLRSNMQRRGPGSRAHQATYEVSKDQYYCDVWSLAHNIDDQERANADDPFDEDRDTAVFLTEQELIKREEEWGSAFFATGKWTGSTTATDLVAGTDFGAWDDITSDPIGDIRKQCTYVQSQTGRRPTDLTITAPGWDALAIHPDILSRVTGGASNGQPAMVTRQLVASLIEVDRVNVASAVRNTGQEGLADSLGFVLGKHAMLTYAPPTAGLRVPSAGYTFYWQGLVGGSDGRRVLKMRDDPAHSDIVEIEATWAQKIVSAALGVFFQNVVS